MLPFKATASDTGGLISVCEFTLGPWDSGPVLHMHTSVDEAFYVVTGDLELQLGEERVKATAGGFVWVPRGVAHAFANAGGEPVRVLGFAVPGGIEEQFAEQAAYLSSVQGPPDQQVLSEIGAHHGAPTLGPPIRAEGAPPINPT
jgi:mannose-6-phosphate isomerase-like protein (cupin superfamily)